VWIAASSDVSPEAAWQFEHGMGRILRVSKEELAKREAAYRGVHPPQATARTKPTEKQLIAPVFA
jgi:hypothetical protein